MSTEWTIRYRGEANPGMDPAAIAALRDTLASDDPLPGLRRPKGQGDGLTLFTGELALHGGGGSREVMSLLDALNALQARFDGLRVAIADSLNLLERDESGRLRVSLDAEDEDEDEDEDSWDAIEGDESDLLDLGAEPLDFVPSMVFDGPDPAFVPFDDLGMPVALGQRELLETTLHPRSRSWTATGIVLSRRPALEGGGFSYEVRGELSLVGAEIAHVVELDLALLGASGEVLAAEVIVLGHDVHRRTELAAALTVAADLARRVTSVQLSVDAYYRHDFDVATWSASRTTADQDAVTVQVPDELVLECNFRRVAWPYPALEVAGRFGNETASYLAQVELTLDVFDGNDEYVTDDDGDFGMTGPGEERPFRLQAPLDEEDEPAAAVLRARLAPRRREVAFLLTLERAGDPR